MIMMINQGVTDKQTHHADKVCVSVVAGKAKIANRQKTIQTLQTIKKQNKQEQKIQKIQTSKKQYKQTKYKQCKQCKHKTLQ